MNKIYTAGIAALFAAVAITASTAPAAAKHHHHHHHGHHHGHWGGDFGFGGVVVLGGYDEPDPIYCVGKHGKLYICGWN